MEGYERKGRVMVVSVNTERRASPRTDRGLSPGAAAVNILAVAAPAAAIAESFG